MQISDCDAPRVTKPRLCVCAEINLVWSISVVNTDHSEAEFQQAEMEN